MTTPIRSRGFSLVELIVGVAVAAVVVLSAVSLLTRQVRSYTASADDRGVQETARIALEELASNLRMAGYGIDPAFAFDFGTMTNAPMDRAPGGALVRIPGYSCGTAVTCRDSVNAPDELVFLSRNPYFNHSLTAPPTTTQLTIQGPLNAPLHRGQILQLACLSGELEWAYVTVGTEVPKNTTGTPVGIPLADGSGTDFPLQNGWLTRTCFQGGPVAVLKVDRFRYFVGTFDTAGSQQTWGTAGARPFLMLDQGLLDAQGVPILTLVAPDVEDLQVTYLFPGARGAAVTAAPSTVGTPLTNGAGGIDLAPAVGVPSYATQRTAPPRLTNHPANIRGVRVAVSVRSTDKRASEGTTRDNQLPAAGNRAAVAAPEIGFRHMLFEATTSPRNIDARTPFIPSLSTTSGADNLNVGGG